MLQRWVTGPQGIWWRDRTALLCYRLLAAEYGLRIRLMRPFGDVVGLAGLLLGLAPFAVIASDAWRAYGVFLICVMALAIWPLIRWFGGINAIMRAAAATDEGTRRLFTDMREGMGNSSAYALLRQIYRPLVDEVNTDLGELDWPCRLEFAGTAADGAGMTDSEFAAVFLRTAGLADLTSLLGNLVPGVPESRRAERRAENRQRLMRNWRALQPTGQSAAQSMNDEEGRNYCLAEVRLTGDEKTPRLVLDLGVAEYGQIARTCEALVNEFALFAFLLKKTTQSRVARWMPGGLAMRPATTLRCMPWRRKAHDDAGSPVELFLRPRYRAAGLGVALATVTIWDGERTVFLGERSERVGTYPNVLHVIPAGNCNTHGSQRPIERAASPELPGWYLQTAMRSEYVEEWFNDEPQETARFLDWEEQVDSDWSAKVTEVTPIALTGVAFDLLNLRPEVCAVVEVAMSGSEILNWEFKTGTPPDHLPLREVGLIRTDTIVQGGAAVLLLAKATLPDKRQEEQRRGERAEQ